MANKKINTKKLSKTEKFVCEMIWGGVPVDIAWIRNSKLFIDGLVLFENGEWKEIYQKCG